MDGTLTVKRDALASFLAGLDSVVVAYSGGVDSTLLAAVSHEVLGEHSLAITAASPALPARGLRQASEVAASRGWNHQVVRTDEMRREEYARNEPDRCYWCKTELLEVLQPLAAARGARVVVGTNADDLSDHRPGIAAARERGVLAPLAEAGLDKNAVRELSAELGLPTATQPASPCLASRFAYGVRVTEEGLRRIERAEEFLLDLGFRELRVRDHGDVARIEVPPDEVVRAASMASEIGDRLKALGFRYVTLDLNGFRSGSLNDVLLAPTFARPSA
ncbi:MAG TPA: ATP-dependent sacrificial sulfur transferase LarE [Actinomycetota bacterium]|nr:ATP-dependent sacrificial sulfur transferase LarE [Actinomycetota bacterium]